MPCYDSRSDLNHPDGQREYAASLRKEFRHNSDVAELLCGLCQQLEARGLIHEINSSSKRAQWWKEHQARDKARRKK